MRHLIIGIGEIGKAIQGIFPGQTLDLTPKTVQTPIDVMHICFPYSEDFVAQVKDYQELYQPTHIIIYSSVAIGTTYKIKGAVHSPVEGRHPDLELSVRQMTRWLGGGNEEERMFFKNLFWEEGIRSRLVEKSKYTEALKLLSTSEYGVNLVFADYKAKVAEEIGMDYKLTKEWNTDYNKLYKALGEDYRFQKYVLDAPNGIIGGHCVIPNAKLLNEDYPDDILDLIEEYDGNT